MLAALVSATVCACGAQRGGHVAIENSTPPEFETTESGLRYRVLREGNGRKPLPTDRVEVDYSGWLDDGTIFESSFERQDPAVMTLATLIPGWAEGIQKVREGGMIELEIPPDLAYGEQGQGPRIPPNSTLHFKIEVRAIK